MFLQKLNVLGSQYLDENISHAMFNSVVCYLKTVRLKEGRASYLQTYSEI